MRFMHAVMVEPKDNNNFETSAFLKTGIHFCFGNVLKAVADPERAIKIAKRYEETHPTMKCTILILSFEEVQRISAAVYVEKMFTDAEFMKGVD